MKTKTIYFFYLLLLLILISISQGLKTPKKNQSFIIQIQKELHSSIISQILYLKVFLLITSEISGFFRKEYIHKIEELLFFY